MVGSRDARKWYARGEEGANFRKMKKFSKNPAMSAYLNSVVNLGFFVDQEERSDTDEESDPQDFTFDDLELSELGVDLAKGYDSAVGRLAAVQQLAGKEHTCTLKSLAEFGKRGGLCELSAGEAADRQLLRDIFFGLVPTKGESHQVRRRSLLLVLELCRQFSPAGWLLNEPDFAGAVYYGTVVNEEDHEDRIKVVLPSQLHDIATRWRIPSNVKRDVRLLHTYEGSLWDRIAKLLDEGRPRRVLIMSPFHDQDAEMVRRVHQRWPKCEIELVVQQQTTNLAVSPLKKLRARVRLSELCNSSRRLHAKLLAWETASGRGCLVGSANFTSAAFDARNVEACLLLSNADNVLGALFDKQLSTRPISLADFDPGTEQEPGPAEADTTTLRLTCAVLTEKGELRVSYRHQLTSKPLSLRLAIRTPAEKRPRALLDLPNREHGSASVVPPESALADAHGTILASLVAEIEDRREESPPIWVVQETRLTYEPSADGPASSKSKMKETGEGLTEFLDELGKSDGVAAVIEYLRHLAIRFNDGGGRIVGQRKFRLRVRDPFRPDVAPDWILHANTNATTLADAIYDFVDRHEKQRLRKHAKRGNINGMENFLDIFTALIRLLYVYHVRGIVHRNKLIGRICDYLQIATSGIDTDQEYSEGYLCSASDNLDDTEYLQEIIDELNFLGHLWAALVIVQKVRFKPGEQSALYIPPKRVRDCLPHIAGRLRNTIHELGLKEPSGKEVVRALEEYKMLTAAELAELEGEITP